MKKWSWLLCLYLFALLATGCKDNTRDASPELPYSSYVSAFTSGKISRFSPVYLIFTHDVPADKQDAAKLSKQIKIKPAVKGTFSFDGNRTVVFKPADGFDRNATYEVTADLSSWFDTRDAEKDFTFTFSTYPAAIRGYLETFGINEKNKNGYDITYMIYTADREKPEAVESLIGSSEKAEAVWRHSPDGKKHEVTYHNVLPGAGQERSMWLSVLPNKLGYDVDETLCSAAVPQQNDFSVYRVEYQRDPERFIEVTFTRLLDETQAMEGLAYLSDNKNKAVNVTGNKLRLYPDNDRTGTLNVHLDKGIRSKDGTALQKSVVEQVDADTRLPDVEFIGKGVIIPQSSEMIVPFRAIYLRGVVVRVIRIFEQNIGQFLQNNDLDGSSNLMQVGRLVARKTILLDETGTADLSRWDTYALDLHKLMEPEPGAIYRIELSFDKRLSGYPCGGELPELSPSQIEADDKIKFREESSRFDNGGYYYYNGDLDWSDYNYEKRNDPCSDSYYFNKTEERNVLATNLGLMAMAGEDNTMTVLVHNIVSTTPEQGVKVTLYNYQRLPVGAGVTDNKGTTRIQLTEGKPYYLEASLGAQRSYLRVDDGSVLSLSAFDLPGEVVQKGIKGFIYGERGVWRPGDTLHLGFMLNDRDALLPAEHPVVMELHNPLGRLYTRKVQTKGVMGVYVFDVPTEADAPTGAWNVTMSVGGVSFSKRVRIEAIKPNRLKINLSIPEPVLIPGEPLDARLHVEWLQGAIARNLKYEIQGTFVSTPTRFEKFGGYYFDDPSKQFQSEESRLISGKTDAEGNAVINAHITVGNSAPGMLLGNLVTRVYEESGDFSIDGTRILYSPYERYAGIWSPQRDKDQLNTGKTYTYKVASVDYKGEPQPHVPLTVDIYKVSWYWWWDADSESRLASYISDSYNRKFKTLEVVTDSQGTGTFDLNLPDDDWGTYFIRVKDAGSRHSTGILSYFDWPYMEGRRNRDGGEGATQLVFKTDKDTYRPGDEMVVTFPSTQGSRAIVSIETGTKVLSVSSYTCNDKETQVKLKVTPDMQPNAYVYITLLQPYAVTRNDLPIRMYGVVQVTVTSAESHLHPLIQTAREIKPESPYEIVVSEQNGRPMAYTLAVVDEGLLDLTHFPTPDPWKAFNALEALGVRTWDLYNYVVGAYGGRIGQMFSIGGDDALNKGPKATANRFRPVVVFDGPFVLKKGEKQKHRYTMPNYNGRVRIMVVAGNGEAYGDAEKSVLVRKPLMLLGTLPRVIGVGEEMVVPATVFATETGIGKVTVTIGCSGNMEIVGDSEKELDFTEKTDKMASFRIRVKDRTGTGRVTLTATSRNDKAVYDTDIEIRSVRQPQTKIIPVILKGGETWKNDVPLPGADGTNNLSLEVADVPPLNLDTRLKYLIGYPHGCVEQIVSKAFPQLYIPALTDLSDSQKQTAEAAVKETVGRLRSYQVAGGAFAYWPGQTSTTGWGTAYAAHFLVEAEKHGYLVPGDMKKGALANIRQVARTWNTKATTPDVDAEKAIQAYRLFVLSLASEPEVGAMNRLKEFPGTYSATRWLLAAAYANIGRKDVGLELTRKTEPLQKASYYADTYGSPDRDKAIQLLALCLLDQAKEAAVLARELSGTFGSGEWMSTQTTSFGLIALSDYLQKYPASGSMDFTYICNRKKESVVTEKDFWTASLLKNTGKTVPVEIRNNGKSTLFARVVTEGVPEQGEEEAYANGVSIAVSYVGAGGGPLDVKSLQQGDNFTAVVTVKNPTPEKLDYLVLTQVFPAGWEILNTRYMDDNGDTAGSATGSASAAASATGRPRAATANYISYQDIRDDRVYTYIDALPSGRQVTVKINLAAVYPGIFYLPPVRCEAMYNHLIQANTKGETTEVK